MNKIAELLLELNNIKVFSNYRILLYVCDIFECELEILSSYSSL